MFKLLLLAIKQILYVFIELLIPTKRKLITKHDRYFMSTYLYIILISISSSAYADGYLHNHGFHPPILFTWSSVWIFSFIGSLCSLIFQELDIERKYPTNKPAKVFMGFFFGIATAVGYDNSITPSGFAVFLAFLSAGLATPIFIGLYLYISKEGKIGELMETFKRWSTK